MTPETILKLVLLLGVVLLVVAIGLQARLEYLLLLLRRPALAMGYVMIRMIKHQTGPLNFKRHQRIILNTTQKLIELALRGATNFRHNRVNAQH